MLLKSASLFLFIGGVFSLAFLVCGGHNSDVIVCCCHPCRWFFPALSRTRAENILKAEVQLVVCTCVCMYMCVRVCVYILWR